MVSGLWKKAKGGDDGRPRRLELCRESGRPERRKGGRGPTLVSRVGRGRHSSVRDPRILMVSDLAKQTSRKKTTTY